MGKLKTAQTKERSALTADYDRKYAELNRMVERKDQLEVTLGGLTRSLSRLTSDRRNTERQLDLIQSHLRENTDMVDEINSEMRAVQDGIKDSVELHMPSPAIFDSSRIVP